MGWTIPDRDFGARLCPAFHPSYEEREHEEAVTTIWMQDLERALGMTNIPLPAWIDESKQVEIVDDLSFLLDLRSTVAVDFEDTGLKPHAAGHRIVCAAVCDREDRAWAFLMPERGSRSWDQFKSWLADPRWLKIASNMKHEDAWARNYVGVDIAGWWHDTMLAAHVLDNRADICSIKFQAYVQLGVVDYASEIEPYLKSDKKNANSINAVEKLLKTESDRKWLLTYCGLDAIYEWRVAMMQRKQMGMEIS